MATTLTGNWNAVESGGKTVYVSGRRVVSDDITLSGKDTTITISSGATVTGITNPESASVDEKYISVTVLSGGSLTSSTLNEVVTYVSSGGTVSDITYDHGQEYVRAGTMSNLSKTYGFIKAFSGAIIDNVSFAKGGYGIANAGAVFSASQVDSGTYITVSSGGLTQDVTLNSGGAQNILTDGLSSRTVVAGIERVGQGGNARQRSAVASESNIVSGGVINVGGGGVTSGTTIQDGGVENVNNDYNAQAYDTHVSSGGVLNVNRYASAINSIVDAGGSGIVSSGGVEIVSAGSGSGMIASGGTISVRAGGRAYNEVIRYSNVTNNSSYIGVAGTDTAVATAVNTLITSRTHGDIGYDYVAGRTDSGIMSATHIESAGEIFVFGKGAAIDTTISSGGRETLLSSGAVASGTNILAGGASQLNNYTTEIGATVAGDQFVGQGGNSPGRSARASSSTVVSGGTLHVGGGGMTSGTTILNGGVENVNNDYNTFASDTVISSGGLLTVRNNARAAGVTIYAGGLENIENGGGSTDVHILSGGLAKEAAFDALKDVYLSSGGQIQLDYFNFGSNASAMIDPTADVMTIVNNGAKTTVQLAGNYITDGQTDQVLLSRADDGKMIAELICYLSGTKIKVPDGDKAVEDLRIGDVLMTYDWAEDRVSSQPVVWVGRKHITVHPGRLTDEAGYPVRIVQNALSQGVPNKDLLVTPEHCLFFEGRFVPVRMLVNGQSIFYDMSITHYDYFHIETEQHAVIWADNTLSESYLDTGNRPSFTQPGTVVAIGAKAVRSWQHDAAAPLDVSRSGVEPLFHALAERAQCLGLRQRAETPMLTADPTLRLLTDDGRLLEAKRIVDDRALFLVPQGVTQVYLVSKTHRPADTIGPFVDDRRHLGVFVGDMTLFDSDITQPVCAHLRDPDLEGWHALEDASGEGAALGRWTAGRATIPLANRALGGVGVLSIHVRSTGSYRQAEGTGASTMMKAAI